MVDLKFMVLLRYKFIFNNLKLWTILGCLKVKYLFAYLTELGNYKKTITQLLKGPVHILVCKHLQLEVCKDGHDYLKLALVSISYLSSSCIICIQALCSNYKHASFVVSPFSSSLCTYISNSSSNK